MNVLATVIGGGLVLVAGGAGIFFEDIKNNLLIDGFAPFDDCEQPGPVAYSDEERHALDSVRRVRVHNVQTGSIRVEVCIYDGDAKKRLHDVATVAAGDEWISEVRLSTDSASYLISGHSIEQDWQGGGGTRGSATDRWCPSGAIEWRIKIVRGGIRGEGPDCTVNRLVKEPGEENASFGTGLLGDQGWGGGAVAAVLGFAGLAVISWAHWPSMRGVAFGLFTRLQRPRILDHKVRNEIKELIESDPGIHANAIKNRLELGEGQTRYHLGVMVREKVLARVDATATRHYFLYGKFSPIRMRIMAALRNPSLDQLLGLIRQHPQLTIGELADRMDHSHSSVSKLARELAEIGLVQSRRDGRRVHLAPTGVV